MIAQDRHEKDGSQNRGDSGGEGPVGAPAFMYVHHLSEQEQESYPVYLFQLDEIDPMETQIKNAVAAIHGGNASEVKPGRLGQPEWRVYSYAVFVLDSAHGEITEVHFEHRDNRGQNHAFDRKAGSVLDGNGAWSAVYYRNKRKNKSGHDLGPTEKDVVEWHAEHSLKDASSLQDIVDHQGSDPNTGP